MAPREPDGIVAPRGHLGWLSTRWPAPLRSSHELQETQKARVRREKKGITENWSVEDSTIVYSIFHNDK